MYIWNGGENIFRDIELEKNNIVKCKLDERRFNIFKMILKENHQTQQNVLEGLVCEYIGRYVYKFKIIEIEKPRRNDNK